MRYSLKLCEQYGTDSPDGWEIRFKLQRAHAAIVAGRNAMSFGIYVTGFLIVIAGLIYGASLMHVPTHWIVVGGIVLVGLGILTGVKATRQKDSAL
jgi:cadmium resistance protein CadD (predicted permease)